MRVIEKRIVTNQEAYLQMKQAAESPAVSEDQQANLNQWIEYLTETGLAGGAYNGQDTEALRSMLQELGSFATLSKQEKFNLVNLPEV